MTRTQVHAMRDLNTYEVGIDVRPVLPQPLWTRAVAWCAAIALAVAYLIGLLG